MKKTITILIIASVAVIFLFVFLDAIWGNGDQRMGFFLLWSDFVLIPVAIPIIFGVFSLAYNRDKLRPKAWLTIYGCVLVIYAVLLVKIGFIDMTKDLPLAIREEFSQINEVVYIIERTDSVWTVKANGVVFKLSNDAFKAISFNKEYTFIYLPNSKYVIDVIDEYGESLLKQ